MIVTSLLFLASTALFLLAIGAHAGDRRSWTRHLTVAAVPPPPLVTAVPEVAGLLAGDSAVGAAPRHGRFTHLSTAETMPLPVRAAGSSRAIRSLAERGTEEVTTVRSSALRIAGGTPSPRHGQAGWPVVRRMPPPLPPPRPRKRLSQ